MAVPDGLEPGPQKSSKITIFNNFCVLNSYDEKRISSYINVVTLRYTLYTTPFVFMITKMIKNPAYPASAPGGLWDQALHCAPKIALRCTVYVIVTSQVMMQTLITLCVTKFQLICSASFNILLFILVLKLYTSQLRCSHPSLRSSCHGLH